MRFRRASSTVSRAFSLMIPTIPHMPSPPTSRDTAAASLWVQATCPAWGETVEHEKHRGGVARSRHTRTGRPLDPFVRHVNIRQVGLVSALLLHVIYGYACRT